MSAVSDDAGIDSAVVPDASSTLDAGTQGDTDSIPDIDIFTTDAADSGDLGDVSADAADIPVNLGVWTKRVRFKLTNSFGAFSGFQVRLDVSPANAAILGVEFDKNMVRFTDNAGNPLPHELEESAFGAAFWVKADLPQTEQYIWMYYDNPTGAAQFQPNIWSNHTAVYHFDGAGEDSCLNTSLSCVGTCSGGQGIGVGYAFTPSGVGAFKYDNIPASVQVAAGEARTISFWYRAILPATSATTLVSAEDNCGGWRIGVDPSGDVRARFSAGNSDGSTGGNGACGANPVSVSTGSSTLGTFHNVVLTIDRSTIPGRMEIWVDGSKKDDELLASLSSGSLDANLLVGGDPAVGRFGEQTIDEVRIRPGVLTKKEIEAQYDNFRPNGWVQLEINSIEPI